MPAPQVGVAGRDRRDRATLRRSPSTTFETNRMGSGRLPLPSIFSSGTAAMNAPSGGSITPKATAAPK